MSGKFETTQSNETTDQLTPSEQLDQAIDQSINSIATQQSSPDKAQAIQDLAPNLINLLNTEQGDAIDKNIAKNPQFWEEFAEKTDV